MRTLSWKLGMGSPPALSATKPLSAERRKRSLGASAEAGLTPQRVATTAAPASPARNFENRFDRTRHPSRLHNRAPLLETGVSATAFHNEVLTPVSMGSRAIDPLKDKHS